MEGVRMVISDEIMRKAVDQVPFGSFEPFVTADEGAVAEYYHKVLGLIEAQPGLSVIREPDHQGSGYASYISAFLYPSDGSSREEHPEFVITSGVLLYLNRLAPVAIYGSSSRSAERSRDCGSSGFIEKHNVGLLPSPEWRPFFAKVAVILSRCCIEIIERDVAIRPAPPGISIPTLFNPPYHLFDTLFYWCD